MCTLVCVPPFCAFNISLFFLISKFLSPCCLSNKREREREGGGGGGGGEGTATTDVTG